MKEFTKIQQKLLTVISPWNTWRHTMINKNHCVTEGHIVYIIPEDEWLLDTEKCFKDPVDKTLHETLSKIIEYSKTAQTLNNLKMTISSEFNNESFCIFENSQENKYIAVKSQHIKSLSKYTFKGTDEKSPIYVYDRNTLILIIIPTIVTFPILTKLRNN